MMMDAAEVVAWIEREFAGVGVTEDRGNWFFFYGAGRDFPFATVVTSDVYDAFSKLGDGRFRVNVGVGKQVFRGLFGEAGGGGEGWDFSEEDRVMPHPVYGRQYWVSVVNPEGTWGQVEGFLRGAWEAGNSKF